MENCAAPRLAVHPNKPATLFHNAIDSGQAEPRSFVPFLGSKEGFEYVRFRFGIHPYSGVGDGEHDVTSGDHREMSLCINGVYFHILSFNHKTAAFRHGIPSVDGQIHDNLLHLSTINLYAVKCGIECGYEFDAFTQKLRKDLAEGFHYTVNIQNLRLQLLLPAKGQKLLGD